MPIDLARHILLRWEDQDAAHVPLLKDGGIDVVLAADPAPPFQKACQSAGIEVLPASGLALVDLAGFRAAGSRPAALSEGLWPGATRGPSGFTDTAVAGASGQPWVDANGFRVASLRALCPGRPAVLAYLPDARAGLKPDRIVPYDTLELALIEARVNGGNYVLAVEPRYRAALVQGEARAMAAWRQLGRTARWLQEHRALFGLPVFPQITALVDGGEATVEIANLLCRQNASPALEPAGAPPAPDPSRRLAIVAASLAPPAPAARARILAHAEAGATVVTDRDSGTPWWRVSGLRPERDEPDRETYRLERGKVVAYKETIADPSDFALDVIDLIRHKRRAVRIWGGPAVIATATAAPWSGPLRGRAVLHAINYGRPLDAEVLAYVQGNYGKAVLLRPEAEPAPLKPARRGTATEVSLPGLRRLGVVVFD